MKLMTIAVLCCSALVYACDNASDKAGTTNEASADLKQSVEQTSKQALETVRNAGDELAQAGTDLKNTVIETTDTVLVASQETMEDTVEATEKAAAPVIQKVKQQVAAASSDDHAQGEAIYTKYCIACHGSGAAGSPKLGDKVAWKPRIAQGEAVMIQHAIAGYKGDTGYMPPKGGAMNLSEAEISQAVKFMAAKAR